MRTAVTETSIAAYHDHRRSGKLTGQQADIMAAVNHGRDYSLQELSRLTDIAVHTVGARVNALVAAGLLVRPEGYKRRCSITGVMINPVRLPIVQRDLFT